jgi:hypothetical protein
MSDASLSEITGLLAQRHDPIGIAQEAIRYSMVSRALLEPEQTLALASWQQWLQTTNQQSHGITRGQLRAAFRLLDKIFFRGQPQSTGYTVDTAFGLMAQGKAAETDPQTKRFKVEVYLMLRPRAAVIGILLHEMRHAFQATFACMGRHTDCQPSERAGDIYQDIVTGRHGHGAAWVMLAVAIERKARNLLGLQVELDTMYCAYREYLQYLADHSQVVPSTT